MHTGITSKIEKVPRGIRGNFFIQNYFGDKKYVYQYLKYCTIQY